MARVKYNTFVDQLSGKIGGIVASDGAYGPYLRANVTPYNPQTTYQQIVRGRVEVVSQAWAGINTNLRPGWEDFALQCKRTNVFGDVQTLTGFNAFMKVNCNRLMMGQAQLTTAPDFVLPTPLTALALSTPGAASVSFTFAPSPVPTGNMLVSRATPGMSLGKSFVSSEFRFMKVHAAAQTTPQNIFTEWSLHFGAVTDDDKIFIQVFPILIASGLPGPVLSADNVAQI